MRIAMLQLFNEKYWAGYAIDQAMKVCDKLLIVEGSNYSTFADVPERSDDGTLDIISDKMKAYPKQIELLKSERRFAKFTHNQCENFNIALSHCDEGDYFIMFDADEFFMDDFIPKVNQVMKEGKIDYLQSEGLQFIFSFKWIYSPHEKMVLLKKIPSLHFVPHNKPRGFGSVCVTIPGDNHHHYSWVKSKERMKLRMRGGIYKDMPAWFDANWDKIKLIDGEEFYYVHLGPFTVNRYDGPHPSLLDNHPWRHIEDIRKVKI